MAASSSTATWRGDRPREPWAMRQLREVSVRLSTPASRSSFRAAWPEVEVPITRSPRLRRRSGPRPAPWSSPSRRGPPQDRPAPRGADRLDRLPLAGGQRASDARSSARCSSAPCIRRCCRSVASGDLGLDAAGDGLLSGDGHRGGEGPLGGAGHPSRGTASGSASVRSTTRASSPRSRPYLTPAQVETLPTQWMLSGPNSERSSGSGAMPVRASANYWLSGGVTSTSSTGR